MKLGLLADIHEDIDRLRLAVDRLAALGAERYVMLGDVFDHGDRARLDATVDLLESVGAVGVWGTHDIGLCVEPDEYIRRLVSARTLDYMGRLRARLEV